MQNELIIVITLYSVVSVGSRHYEVRVADQ